MANDQVVALLPCPFCGAPAVKRWCRIDCTRCPCSMSDPHADETAHTAAWNRRFDFAHDRRLREIAARQERGLS